MVFIKFFYFHSKSKLKRITFYVEFRKKIGGIYFLPLLYYGQNFLNCSSNSVLQRLIVIFSEDISCLKLHNLNLESGGHFSGQCTILS